MRIGVPKEVKNHEYRVGLVPGSVAELVRHGHRVLVQAGAGAGIGIPDADYVAAGADIADGAARVWAEAEMVVKVKEPLAEERRRLRPTSSRRAISSPAARSASPTRR
jgi:alanine dehydrogenase